MRRPVMSASDMRRAGRDARRALGGHPAPARSLAHHLVRARAALEPDRGDRCRARPHRQPTTKGVEAARHVHAARQGEQRVVHDHRSRRDSGHPQCVSAVVAHAYGVQSSCSSNWASMRALTVVGSRLSAGRHLSSPGPRVSSVVYSTVLISPLNYPGAADRSPARAVRVGRFKLFRSLLARRVSTAVASFRVRAALVPH